MGANASAALGRKKHPWVFFLWLAVFYTVWSLLVFGGDRWAIVQEHWPIAAAMAAGSYVAGSTPMGGGTVGFPILVLLFDQPADIGRNFGLAVQSIGMVSASIFILAMRREIAWRFLRWAMLGSLIATPLCAAFVAPYAPGLFVKILFAVIWASFGIMHFVRLKEIVASHGHGCSVAALDRRLGLAAGVLGGLIASITGVGIDMLLYAVLVVLFRTDLKIAIPTSVIIMAFTSVVGIATNAALGTVQPEVFANWLAAAPIVALGAPLGAFVVQYVRREPTLLIVSALCVGQFVWTILDQKVTGWALFGAIGGVLAFNALFHAMHEMGNRLNGAEAARLGASPAAPVVVASGEA